MERPTKQVDTKPSNWKNKLSPGFAEEEVFYSLLILGIFYVIYAAVKVNFDAQENSIDDEERFIQSCYCSFNQRFFLRFLFSLCCVLWFIAHTYGFLSIISIKRFVKFGKIIKVFLPFLIICPCYCIKSFCTSKGRQGSYKVANYENKETLERLNNNVRRLWFQYCKLYVIGYTEYDDSTDSITKQTKKQQSEYYQSKQRKNGENCSTTDDPKRKNGEKHSATNNEQYKCVCCNHQMFCRKKNKICFGEKFYNVYSLKNVTRVSLFFVKYISQLSSVPLLLLQIFDTYSFLCFSPDLYCSNSTEYELNLLQVCITLLFYCSIVMSHLASTILMWHPWPKDEPKYTCKKDVNKSKPNDNSQEE